MAAFGQPFFFGENPCFALRKVQGWQKENRLKKFTDLSWKFRCGY